jgi:hypothetical protein
MRSTAGDRMLADASNAARLLSNLKTPSLELQVQHVADSPCHCHSVHEIVSSVCKASLTQSEAHGLRRLEAL